MNQHHTQNSQRFRHAIGTLSQMTDSSINGGGSIWSQGTDFPPPMRPVVETTGTKRRVTRTDTAWRDNATNAVNMYDDEKPKRLPVATSTASLSDRIVNRHHTQNSQRFRHAIGTLSQMTDSSINDAGSTSSQGTDSPPPTRPGVETTDTKRQVTKTDTAWRDNATNAVSMSAA